MILRPPTRVANDILSPSYKTDDKILPGLEALIRFPPNRPGGTLLQWQTQERPQKQLQTCFHGT